MKVIKQDAVQAFKPIALQVVFETQEEVDAFRQCAGYDVTIPDALVRMGEPKDEVYKFVNILTDMKDALYS